MPRRDHVTKRDIEVSLSWVKTVLNKEITEQRGQIREQNEALLRSFTSGAISQKELAEGWKREPQPLKNKCLRTLQKKFAKSSGLTKQACNTSGNYLPYDDPQMCEKLEGTDNIVFASSTCGHGHVLYTAIKIDQNCSVIQYIERRWTSDVAWPVSWSSLNVQKVTVPALRSRARFDELRRRKNIPLSLTLNYDQTWIAAFRSPKTTLRKTMRLRGKKEVIRTTSIVGARLGITLCTSSWADGCRGPLFISVGPRSLSNSFVERINRTVQWRFSVFL